MEKLFDSTKPPISSVAMESELPINPELARIYTMALAGREPRDGEFDAWLNVLGGYPIPDLESAVLRWQADTEIEDFTGRPKGARVPTAVELKASTDAWMTAKTKKFIPCGSCDHGWVKVSSGTTVGGHPVDKKIGAVKRCRCFEDYMRARREQRPAKKSRRSAATPAAKSSAA